MSSDSEIVLPGSSSPNFASVASKRGFRCNSKAGLLRKKFLLENTSSFTERVELEGSLTPESNDSAKDVSTSSSLDGLNIDIKENYFKQSDLPQKFSRVMVIGTRGSGKHSFVNSLFSPNPDELSPKKQLFDLVTKTITNEKQKKRYDFWLKEADSSPKDYKTIFDVYYKSCSVFFLICNPINEDSFNSLEKELKLLRDAKINQEKCIVIMKKGQAENNDSISPADVIQQKYGLKYCFEISQESKFKKHLLDLIDQSSKCLDFLQQELSYRHVLLI